MGIEDMRGRVYARKVQNVTVEFEEQGRNENGNKGTKLFTQRGIRD